MAQIMIDIPDDLAQRLQQFLAQLLRPPKSPPFSRNAPLHIQGCCDHERCVTRRDDATYH